MSKSNPKARPRIETIAAYLAAQPEASRPVLARVRATLRAALPGLEEVISYRIPAYKCEGRIVIYFAGWKAHYSLYPLTDHIARVLGDRLALYETGKGTIRFPLGEPVPVALIRTLARLRLEEVSQAAAKRNRTVSAGRSTKATRAESPPARKAARRKPG